MKTKEIEKLIKQQANMITRPSVLSNIKKQLDIDENQIIEKRPKRFGLRLTVSLGFSMIMIFALSIGIIRVQTSDPINDDSIVEALVLSSIASTEIATNALEVSADSEVMLVANQSSTSQSVEDEIIDEANYLTTYINMMATLTNTNQKFSIQKDKVSTFSNQYKLSFSDQDFRDENKQYTLTYETVDHQDDVYTLEGVLTFNTQSYEVKISYDRSKKTLTYETYKAEDQYVRIMYARQDGYAMYELSHVIDDEVVESIEVSFENRLNISFSFTKGEASGTYGFALKTGLLGRRYLEVNYQVGQYQGVMQIAVSLENRDEFVFVVTPDDGETFTFNQQRNRNGQ